MRGSLVVGVAALLLAAAGARAQEASAASELPAVSVTVGIAGMSTFAPGCQPIRLDIAGGSRPFDGEVRLQALHGEPATELRVPVAAEPGSRRTLHVTACGHGASGWRWSLDGKTWADIAPSQRISGPLVVVIGEDLGRFEPLEEALGGSSPDASRTAILAPSAVPVDARGWSQAPFVLLDSRAAQALAPEAISALRDHVIAGATLVVAGIEDSGLPDGLLASSASIPGMVALTNDDGTSVDVPARVMEIPLTGRLIEWGGAARPWMPTRRIGAGRLVMLGVDLRDDAVRAALDRDAWLAIAGLTAGSMTPTDIGDPAWALGVEAALERARGDRTAATPVPPVLGGAYLIAAGIALLTGTWMLGRRAKGAAPRAEVALLLGAICVPGFLLGLFRSGPASSQTTVIEHWPALGRSRVLTWTPITHDGEIALPPGVHAGRAKGVFAQGFPAATFRLGAQPSVRLPSVPRFGNLMVLTEEWRSESAPPPLHGVTLGIRKGVPEAIAGADPFLTDLAATAAGSGLHDGYVRLEPLTQGSPRMAWIVHQVAP